LSQFASSDLLNIGEHYDELVAANPCKRLRRAEGSLQPVGHEFQQPVASGMTESIVDGLEAIEIEGKDSESFAVAFVHVQGL
jgi:hypothetical protein